MPEHLNEQNTACVSVSIAVSIAIVSFVAAIINGCNNVETTKRFKDALNTPGATITIDGTAMLIKTDLEVEAVEETN